MEFIDNILSWCKWRYEKLFIKPLFRDKYVTIYKTRKGIIVDSLLDQDEMEKRYDHIFKGLMFAYGKCSDHFDNGKGWERDER